MPQLLQELHLFDNVLPFLKNEQKEAEQRYSQDKRVRGLGLVEPASLEARGTESTKRSAVTIAQDCSCELREGFGTNLV